MVYAVWTDFRFDFEGKQISVTQYFANKYKIHLKAPQMFLAIGRFGQKSALYPLELLKVAPNQRVIGQQQTPEQISKMVCSESYFKNSFTFRESLIQPIDSDKPKLCWRLLKSTIPMTIWSKLEWLLSSSLLWFDLQECNSIMFTGKRTYFTRSSNKVGGCYCSSWEKCIRKCVSK